MSTRLPVIVGFGGYGPAGRSSNHHAYRRMVFGSLTPEQQQETVISLAVMMKLVTVKNGQYLDQQGDVYSALEVADKFTSQVLDGTLVRRIEKSRFDVDAVPTHKSLHMLPSDSGELSFRVPRKQLPSPMPVGWTVAR